MNSTSYFLRPAFLFPLPFHWQICQCVFPSVPEYTPQKKEALKKVICYTNITNNMISLMHLNLFQLNEEVSDLLYADYQKLDFFLIRFLKLENLDVNKAKKLLKEV